MDPQSTIAMEEDLFLTRLINGRFYQKATADFIESLHSGAFELSPKGAEAFWEAVLKELEEGQGQSQHCVNVLEALSQTLEFSPCLVAYINDLTPVDLQALQLPQYIIHPNKALSSPVVTLVGKVVETCPKLTNWRTFVRPAEHPGVEEVLVPALAHVVPAKELPTFESLGQRLQSSVQNKFGSSRERKPELQQKLSDLFPEKFAQVEVPSAAPAKEPGQGQELEMASVSDHIHQMQEEMLKSDERVVRASIAATYALYRSAKDKVMQDRQFALLQSSQRALVELHLERRKLKEKRLQERLRYVEQLSSKGLPADSGLSPEILAAYKGNVKLQRDALVLLERLYDALVGAIQFANVSYELSYLDRQISVVYDVSFSVVVAGLISVGKSTFVNCITGQNLCPNRVETMTAIPTNYVHDPTAIEPVMMVPFADQLNHVMNTCRQLIAHYGKEEVVLAAGGKRHLKALIDKIDEGLLFQPKYVGAPSILEHSTYIHDLFRLSVEDALAETLAPLLPMDWSQGLDTYLTVFVRFPRAEIATGLVNFSIVDTPGINEFGVRRLDLRKSIREALSVSSFGALIATKVCPNATDMGYLKTLFYNTKRKYRLPMATILTYSEELTTQEEAIKRKENVSLGLSPDMERRTFEVDDIFPVSGRRMAVATQANIFIQQHGRKPELNSTDPKERDLAEDFLDCCLGGGLREDLLEKYQDASKEDVLKFSARAIKSSAIPATIDHLMNFAVKDGIKVLVQNAFNRSREVIKNFVDRYQALDVQRLKRAEGMVQDDIRVLNEKKQDLARQVAEFSLTTQNKIRDQAATAKMDLNQVLQQNVQREEPHLLSSLTDHIQNMVSKIPDEKTKALVYQMQPVKFPSELAIKQAQAELPLKFKLAIQMYFWTLNKDVPNQAVKFTSRRKAEIEESLRKIGERYRQDFNIQLSADTRNALDYPDDQEHETIDFAFRMVKKKNFGVLSFLLPRGHSFEVHPTEVRTTLKAFSEDVLEEKAEAVRRVVEKRVKETTTEFLVVITNEIKRLSDGAMAVQQALSLTNEKVTAPVNELVKKIDAVLNEMANMTTN